MGRQTAQNQLEGTNNNLQGGLMEELIRAYEEVMKAQKKFYETLLGYLEEE